MINNNNYPDRDELSCKELFTDKNKVAICRCWKSKKFPFCDGSHRDYNNESGDKLGPIVILKD